MTASAYLSLTEFSPAFFAADALSAEDQAYLRERFAHRIGIREEGRGGARQLRIAPQGVVGHIGLPSGLRLLIQPKVPIAQLFEMIRWVYELDSIEIDRDGASLDTAPYDRLFEHVLDRLLEGIDRLLKSGLFREFRDARRLSNVVRGRIDPVWLATHPQATEIMSEQSELTIDNAYNQVLRTTLTAMVKRPHLSRALRTRIGYLLPYLPVAELLDPTAVLDQLEYGRRQNEYRLLHDLCLFLLESLMPTHHSGGFSHPSFLIETAPLFERFVAKWLEHALDARFRVQVQKRKRLDASPARYITPDILIYASDGDQPIAVFDTKYKQGERPELNDIYQVTFYAAEFEVKQAGLIYPHAILEPLIGQNREVAYRTLSFDLSRPIDEAGKMFLKEIDSILV